MEKSQVAVSADSGASYEDSKAGGPLFSLVLALLVMFVGVTALALDHSTGVLVVAALLMCVVTGYVVVMIGRLIGDEDDRAEELPD